MNLLRFAPYVLGGSILALLVYEGFALFNRQAGDTISEIVWAVAFKRPIVPFLFGVLMGHFFWLRT